MRVAILVALRDWPLADAFLTTGPGYWYASLLLSGWKALRSEGAARLRQWEIAAVKFVFPGGIPLTLFVLELTSRTLHRTYDNYLYAFDGLLPFPVAEATGRIFSTHPWIDLAFRIDYYSFVIMPCLFVVLWGRDIGRLTGWLTSRWIVAGLFGCALYFVMPAIGPKLAFDVVHPGGLPDAAAVPLSFYSSFAIGPRNAMPSLHTAWALLIAIVGWRMAPAPRIVALVNLIGTVVATLGLREHYVIDLVVAVPFTVGVHGLVSLSDHPAGGRRQAAAAAVGGALLTAAWLLTIGFAIGPLREAPWMASMMVLVTLIASGWLLWRLERAAEQRVVGLARSSLQRG
jgi:hypothetical protein